jgi:hypothetical protein
VGGFFAKYFEVIKPKGVKMARACSTISTHDKYKTTLFTKLDHLEPLTQIGGWEYIKMQPPQ